MKIIQYNYVLACCGGPVSQETVKFSVNFARFDQFSFIYHHNHIIYLEKESTPHSAANNKTDLSLSVSKQQNYIEWSYFSHQNGLWCDYRQRAQEPDNS